MTGPRNRPGFARGQAIREEIRLLLESRSQADPLLDAEDIRRQLSRPLALRTIRLYVQQLRSDMLP